MMLFCVMSLCIDVTMLYFDVSIYLDYDCHALDLCIVIVFFV